MRTDVIEAIKNEKIIVIVRGVDKEKLVPLCQAMYDGGIRLLEITYDASGKVSNEETASNIRTLSELFGDKMYIGAGTVLKEKQVILTKEAGGSFIISPDTNEEVIKKTVELDMVSMPGGLTPTECNLAHSFGADFVKLFPVDTFGPSYVKAIKAPLSHISFTAVGGINLGNIPSYIAAGVSGFGVGTNIVDKKLVENGKFDEITKLAQQYVEVVKG